MHYLVTIWAWIQANPTLVLLAWPIVTALVTAAFGAAEKYADSRPRLHVVLTVFETAGFDASWVLGALKKAVLGAPKGSGIALLLVGIAWGCLAITNVRDVHVRALPVLSMEGCTPQQVQTANDYINGFLNTAQYACTQLSQVSDVQQLAIVCGIINMGDKLAPAVEHFIESLILGRQSALAKGMMFDHAGAVWFKPALDGGAP